MSFKREGNDKGLLDNLRRRRVKELLGEDIPEDEAKLLCNGRFACLVCNYNPVFDTVNMLMVHRQGKKHAASEEVFLRKKKELKALIIKRKHEQYMKDGTTTIRQAAAASSGGIKPVQPYDPRVKKHKEKPYDRKLCLDLHSNSLCSPDSDAVSDLQAFSTALPEKHTHQLKNIFRLPQRNQAPVAPYVRQNTSSTVRSNTSSHHQPHHSVHSMPSSVSQTSAIVSSKHPESQSSSTSSSLSHPCLNNCPPVSFELNNSSNSISLGVGTSSAKVKRSNKSAHCVIGSSIIVKETTVATSRPSVFHPTESVGHSETDVMESSKSADVTGKKRLAEKYYHLSGSGWKKDWDGKWIRDEGAEFDSDEEPPDLP